MGQGKTRFNEKLLNLMLFFFHPATQALNRSFSCASHMIMSSSFTIIYHRYSPTLTLKEPFGPSFTEKNTLGAANIF